MMINCTTCKYNQPGHNGRVCKRYWMLISNMDCIVSIKCKGYISNNQNTMPTIKKTFKRYWQPKHKPFERNVAGNEKFYHSQAWKDVRAEKLRMNPLCEECEKHCRMTTATVVDHIKPINEGGERLAYSNLQSLCPNCHNRKHGRNENGNKSEGSENN